MKKLGYQAPVGWKSKCFNYIGIDGDLHYCSSHNFVYNTSSQKELLYNAQPNINTDKRFDIEDGNFYKQCYLYNGRYKTLRDKKKKSNKINPIFIKPHKSRVFGKLSLKACLRRVKRVSGIPIGTIVKFDTAWYYPSVKINTSYYFKITKDKPLAIKFEANLPEYNANFKYCDFSKELTNRLREAGFIVSVYNSNPDFIYGENEGEIAMAYGYGKQIGYSSKNNNFRGYYDGQENILYDYLNRFNKWSQCIHISKTESIDTIIEILKRPEQC